MIDFGDEKDYLDRSMPIRSLYRANPRIYEPISRIEKISKTGRQRLWILVSQYLSITEILNLMKTCKMLYFVSYEAELWLDILINQYNSYFVLSIINGSYKCVNIATGIDYKTEEALIDKYIPIYCDQVRKVHEDYLMENFQKNGAMIDQAPPLTSDDLKKIDPSKLRNIAITLYQLSCFECYNIKIDCFYCEVLRKCVCLKCLKLDKYRF